MAPKTDDFAASDSWHVGTTYDKPCFHHEMTNPVDPRTRDAHPTAPADENASLRAENAALRAELAEARKSNQQYLQNVAHQLTAPLGAIKWSIEALKDPEVSLPRKSKLLGSIYSQATILVQLIKNFSLMSNLEADLELGQFRKATGTAGHTEAVHQSGKRFSASGGRFR